VKIQGLDELIGEVATYSELSGKCLALPTIETLEMMVDSWFHYDRTGVEPQMKEIKKFPWFKICEQAGINPASAYSGDGPKKLKAWFTEYVQENLEGWSKQHGRPGQATLSEPEIESFRRLMHPIFDQFGNRMPFVMAHHMAADKIAHQGKGTKGLFDPAYDPEVLKKDLRVFFALDEGFDIESSVSSNVVRLMTPDGKNTGEDRFPPMIKQRKKKKDE
jgi:hypothetical protein